MSHLEPTGAERVREDKLPAWAQDTLSRLRAAWRVAQTGRERAETAAEELSAKLAEYADQHTGPADSTAFLWREDGGEQLPRLGLGKDATIEFEPEGGRGLYTVEASDGGIRVHGDGNLVIYPLSGRNEILIKVV